MARAGLPYAICALLAAGPAAMDGAFAAGTVSVLPPEALQGLADDIFREQLAERRAAVIEAEAGRFAELMAAVYLGDGSSADWRAQLRRIHDRARVSGLLLAALQARLAARDANDLLPTGGATGVALAKDGRGLALAARLELARPGALEAAAERLETARRADSPVLDAIRQDLLPEAEIDAMLAAHLNRQIAFAEGFHEADGFGFPADLDDVAADLSLQIEEQRREILAEAEITAFAAYAPLGVAAIARIGAARNAGAGRARQDLMALAESDVLDQLARESGRAAAKRDEGQPL
ncbi:hypothetical protein [Paracoccus jeotgali]|nr:hypothetical protein [Paracoccus jeotgali]